jgi:aldehyde dehydrogenase (NAD+)
MDLRTLNRQFIGGVWRDGSLDKKLVDYNAYDGSTVAEFTCADLADVDEAYRAAERA